MPEELSFDVERPTHDDSKFDDDGRVKRTGTLTTTTAHIITAVIGSGVLLAWATAQLGWIAGPVALIEFSVITWFTSVLLADCYRSPITGRRNNTYMDVVKSNLGFAQPNSKPTRAFPALHHRCNHVDLLLTLFIGLGLSMAQIAGGARPLTSITGVVVGNGLTAMDKVWGTFSALGDIGFAYAFSTVLIIEIQDTLKPSPPENIVMKKAATIGNSISTIFYMLCGLLGYSAFGNRSPGNLLTGFVFFEPFWLVDLGNVHYVCIMVHLVGAYQVFAQPVFGFVEEWSKRQWPEAKFVTKERFLTFPGGDTFGFSFFRLVWRTTYVVLTTLVAMAFPNFNHVVGLLGAASFWPLTVFFPIEMYIAQAKIRKFSFTWIWMQILSFACLIISLLAAARSIRGLIKNLHTFEPFKSQS